MIRVTGFDWVDLGYHAGGYDRWVNPKLVWHTTEGASLSGAEAAFRKYPPHLGVDPDTGDRHQYVSLDEHAASLAGSANEADTVVVQLEVVGYAAETHDWSERRLQWLADNVVVPVANAVAVPPVVCPQGFHGAGEGMVLASPDSPIRFSLGDWNGFAGHVGHQHAPAPDEHWDPGALDVARILDLATQPAPTPEVHDMAAPATCIDSDGRAWVFYKGPNGELWARCQGDPPFGLGGNVTDAIAVTPGDRLTFDVYAYAPNGQLWSRHASGYDWGDWYLVAA